jgi:hypothetical protein
MKLLKIGFWKVESDQKPAVIAVCAAIIADTATDFRVTDANGRKELHIKMVDKLKTSQGFNKFRRFPKNQTTKGGGLTLRKNKMKQIIMNQCTSVKSMRGVFSQVDW